jgi:phage-related protein
MIRILQKRLPAAFWKSASGSEPVRDWLRALNAEDRKIVGLAIRRVEFGWPVGMPLCRALGRGIWEIRSDLTNGRTVRVLFCVYEGEMMLLHLFMKKTQKTPNEDLDLAHSRMRKLQP